MCQSAAKQYCYCQIKRLQLSGVNNSDPFTVAVDWDLTEKNLEHIQKIVHKNKYTAVNVLNFRFLRKNRMTKNGSGRHEMIIKPTRIQ